MTRRLMIYTVRPGDLLTMHGPDKQHSEPFVLSEFPEISDGNIWLYREFDMPIVLERGYALGSTFTLHHRPEDDLQTTDPDVGVDGGKLPVSRRQAD